MSYIHKFTNNFPLIIFTVSVISLLFPSAFTWFTGDLITIGLCLIMLGMGLTLKPADFKGIFLSPKWVLTGIVLQFTVMPSLGYFLALLFELPAFLAAGLILVSCCPGGTASNVIAYLARANVALSVTMTAVSTFLAIILTPVLTTLLVGNSIEVEAQGLFWNTVNVILVPVTIGICLNSFFPVHVKKVVAIAPAVAVIFITLIVASIIGSGREIILNSAVGLFGSVFCLHLLGFSFGYILSKIYLKDESVARTIAIEVGMQNSGLGAILARKNFPDPVTAVPSAISSLTHCVIGSIFAFLTRIIDRRKNQLLGQEVYNSEPIEI